MSSPRNDRRFVELLETRRLMQAAGWSDTIDNPLLPMLPGATWLYKGSKGGAAMKDRLVVQSYTKTIKGVDCVVVLDRVYVSGKLEEKTHDFFAQDKLGNVWYFGEDSRAYAAGQPVSTEGSWEAGVNGANPGIVMQAMPKLGNTYHQEFATGVAEDQATVLSLGGKVKTPFGKFSNCLITQEFSNLEPDVAEYKYYQAGIGLVESQSVRGEVEILKLASFFP